MPEGSMKQVTLIYVVHRVGLVLSEVNKHKKRLHLKLCTIFFASNRILTLVKDFSCFNTRARVRWEFFGVNK